MCIIMFKPENKVIPTKYFEESFAMNPDGIGYSYIVGEGDNAKIITKKFMKYKRFLKNYEKDSAENLATTPFLIHFRACSVGTVNVDNAHPFVINEGQVFAHNGTIRDAEDDPKKKKSDTVMFNETILKKLPFGWEKNDGILRLICNMLGILNRVVVLNKNKEYLIFNEKKGVWDDGVWYSNEHYLGTYIRGTNGLPVLRTTEHKGEKWEDEEKRWNEYWDSDWNYVEDHRNPAKQGNIFDINAIEGNASDDYECICEFCGTKMQVPVSIVNKEFDHKHEICTYCATSLTTFRGINYVN